MCSDGRKAPDTELFSLSLILPIFLFHSLVSASVPLTLSFLLSVSLLSSEFLLTTSTFFPFSFLLSLLSLLPALIYYNRERV